MRIDKNAPDFIAWEDINGIDDVKKEIVEIIDYLKNPALLRCESSSQDHASLILFVSFARFFGHTISQAAGSGTDWGSAPGRVTRYREDPSGEIYRS